MINFASENFDAVHPQIMEALLAANIGFAASYGKDQHTAIAIDAFKKEFGENIEVFFNFNGTGANVFGLSCLTDRHQAILCSSVSHLYVDEGTAPEALIGARLYPVDHEDGKVTVAALARKIGRMNDIHHPQVKVVTLTQPTEYGTVYTLAEIKAIKTFCKTHHLLLHVDGARFFNAASALNVSLKDLSADIDVLTLGGTKLGLMYGEAVVFFNSSRKTCSPFMHKRSTQLASKNRFIAAQFTRLLTNNLWLNLANHTNHLAKFFEHHTRDLSAVEIAFPVQTNSVFLKMSKSLFQKMQVQTNFYYWNEENHEARLIFSFNNTEEEIMHFIADIERNSQALD